MNIQAFSTARRLRSRFRFGALLAAAGLLVAGPALAEKPTAAAAPAGEMSFLSGGYDVKSLGYTREEFLVSGSARAFKAAGPLGEDGVWKAKPAGTAAYRTRIVVMKPQDEKAFNGTVIVEWINVTGGLDVPVEWITTHRELVRKGYAYVAVSAQKVGIDGDGRTPPPPFLKNANAARYGALVHPGDAYSYDIFTDAARLLRSPQKALLLGKLQPKRLLAVGESQSAIFLTTYVNAIEPVSRQYDGFLIHSRPGPGSLIDDPSIFKMDPAWYQTAVKLRPNLRVPVLQLITETDLVQLIGAKGYYAARQPDAKNLRTWELAGAAHLDNYLIRVGFMDTPTTPVEALAGAWAPMSMGSPALMNNGPQQHYVAQAAIDKLNTWVASGKAPSTSPLLKLNPGAPPTLMRDELGIALGGIRTPWVDAPVSRLSGSDPETAAQIGGSVTPFDKVRLAGLYPGGQADYMPKFTASLDAAIRDGFLLADDREEILKLGAAGFDLATK